MPPPPRPTPSRPALRRPETALFVLAFGVYAYFFQAGGWNQNSRFALTRAVVEGRTVVIDDYVSHTGDFSVRNGHIYCDKAPGQSLAAVPVHAAVVTAVRTFTDVPHLRGRHIHLSAYLSTVFTVGLPSALAVALIFRLIASWGAPLRVSAAVAAAYAFGTQALPYSTLFYAQQTAAALLVFAFAALALDRGGSRSPSVLRLLVCGASLGTAIAFEYPAALAAVVIGVYAARTVRPLPRLGWIAAGALPPILVLAAYHWVAFGGPFTTGYSATVAPGRAGGLWLGITLPHFHLLDDILFSLERGLFRHAPWLALAIPGAVRLLRSRPLRAEGLTCAAMIALFLVFNCSLTRTPDDWRGGAGIGPRYLIPSLPFYALALGGLLATPLPSWWTRRTLRLAAVSAFSLLAVLSTGRMFLATAVQPEVDKVDDPWADWLIPHWQRDQIAINTVPMHGLPTPGGRQAWNLGDKLSLQGRGTALPLGALALGVGWWMVALLTARRSSSHASEARRRRDSI